MATMQPDIMHFRRVANDLRDQIYSATEKEFSENLKNYQLNGKKIRAPTRVVDDALSKCTSQLNSLFSDPDYGQLRNTYFLTHLENHYKINLKQRLYDLKSALPEFAENAIPLSTNPGIKV